MTDTLDPRDLLAKMDAEQQAAEEKAKRLAEENAAKRKELLDQLRVADLEDVKDKIKLHGFTATDLKSVLKTRASAKKTTTRRRTAAKKKA